MVSDLPAEVLVHVGLQGSGRYLNGLVSVSELSPCFRAKPQNLLRRPLKNEVLIKNDCRLADMETHL